MTAITVGDRVQSIDSTYRGRYGTVVALRVYGMTDYARVCFNKSRTPALKRLSQLRRAYPKHLEMDEGL